MVPIRPERDVRLMQNSRKETIDNTLLELANFDKARGSRTAAGTPQEAIQTVPHSDRRSGTVDWISEVMTEEVSILVSDMSGFTRTVREHGILHFASIIARKRQICMPIFKRHGAVKILTEGDDLIAIFKDVLRCALAAVEMVQTIDVVNAALGEDRKGFAINLGGVGVHCGMGIIIDKHGTVSGEPFRGAYYLGETLSDEGNILFSSAVVDRVRLDPTFATASFTEGGDNNMMAFVVTGAASLVQENIPDADDPSHLDPELLPLAKRHLLGADVAAVDAQMAKQHIKQCTVLMFDLDLAGIGPEPKDSEVLCAKFYALELISDILKRRSGRGLEDLLWIFENVTDALLAALDVRQAIRTLATDPTPNTPRFEVTGYGIHCGSLLLIEGTDVHWGDPVNTASKLGQDMATGGQILATQMVKDAALSDPRCEDLHFDERSMVMSGVEFVYFSVEKACVEAEIESTSPPPSPSPTPGAVPSPPPSPSPTPGGAPTSLPSPSPAPGALPTASPSPSLS